MANLTYLISHICIGCHVIAILWNSIYILIILVVIIVIQIIVDIGHNIVSQKDKS